MHRHTYWIVLALLFAALPHAAAAQEAEEARLTLDQLLTLRLRDYNQTRGPEKAGRGDLLIRAYLQHAEAERSIGNLGEVLSLYRRALGVAQAVGSGRVEGLRFALRETVRRKRVAEEVDRLEAALRADPGDRRAAAELMRIHVVELDNPAAAERYALLAEDPAWRANVPLAALPVEHLDASQILALADWYRKLAGESSPPRPAMLARAAGYYWRYLVFPAAPQLGSAQRALRDVEQALADSHIEALALAVHPATDYAAVTVPATRNQDDPLVTGVDLAPGQRLVLRPNPGDRWTKGHGDKKGVPSDYRGYAHNGYPDADRWMRMEYRIGDGPAKPVVLDRVIVSENDGPIQLFVYDNNAEDNFGRIHVALMWAPPPGSEAARQPDTPGDTDDDEPTFFGIPTQRGP